MRQRDLWLLLIGLIVLASGLSYLAPVPLYGEFSLPEQQIVEIPLAGPLAGRSAEISGLAWVGEDLILLPQYPGIFDKNGDGLLFYLPKQEITAFLDGVSTAPLEPRPI